ncbi:MAG: ABC transporter ATP-binding protein [Ornithinimicrobium sp.]
MTTGAPLMAASPASLLPRGEVVLQCAGVTKRFGATTAVNDVSFELKRGEALAVVGPSGCGKSTLLRMMAGLTSIDAGMIAVAGREVAGDTTFVPAEKRGVGIVFQDLALFPHLSVADNIAFGLKRSPIGDAWGQRGHRGSAGPRRQRRPRGQRLDEATHARVSDMLELVGLTRFGDRFPHQLSGGEQQRVAIARALALNPEVVLLDEPFSQLDRGLAARVRDEAIQALRSAGASVVLVTHDQEEALAVGDRVAVLQAGRLVQLAEPEEVFHHPCNRFVSTFLGEADFVAGVRRGSTASTALGDLPVVAGPDGDVEVMTRPHDLTVLPLSAQDSAERIAGEAAGVDAGDSPGGVGVVRRVEFRGGDVLHHVLLESGPIVRALTSHTRKIAVGEKVLVPTPVDHPLTAFDVACPTHKATPSGAAP